MQKIQFPDGMINDGIKKLFTILSEARCEARFVGGCVRDAIIGNAVSDIDIAVNMRPDVVMKILQQNGVRYIPTGLKHGTITALIDGITVEITSLRKDIDCDGRHAVVEFTSSWEEDALRRDFTVNAMYADIDGNLYDFHSGFKDVNSKIIRFVGNAAKRIEEDTLRILRYYRFVSSHGSIEQMDAEAIQACRIYAIQLENLSGERIQMEMRKIVNSKQAADIIDIMGQHGITKQIGLTLEQASLLKELITLEQEFDTVALDSLAKLASLIRQGSKAVRDAALTVATNWKLSNRDGVL
ncbi:MAG: CCA tRNA nucleotidyltransferase, partial [Rickettsiales bacterium]|nr:CCA tRNA nucleotidyltransferase [Rickettsiales bacterium]